jgi:hypothetical protein
VARFNLVCGLTSPGDYDYESFNKWLDGKKSDHSILTIIDTNEWRSYIFPGDLQKLTENSLVQFVDSTLSKLKKKEEDTAFQRKDPSRN